MRSDLASFKRIDEVVHVHLHISQPIVCWGNMFCFVRFFGDTRIIVLKIPRNASPTAES